MNIDIYSEGVKLDMYEETDIRFTFQVNDIADIRDRQASYTNSFRIPRTATNVVAFKGLGIPSDTSRLPYMKPDTRLQLEGIDLVRKGWLNIQESSDDEYNCYVYTGLINFFKAIENKKFGDIDLSELEHTKTIQHVIDSIDQELPYRYFVADYNGDTFYDSGFNIDYMVPSVRISYLWNAIHSAFGMTAVGDFMNQEDYVNTWLTYPKASDGSDRLEKYLYATSANVVGKWPIGNSYSRLFLMENREVVKGAWAKYPSNWVPPEFEMYGAMVVPEAGEYKIKITGRIPHETWIGGGIGQEAPDGAVVAKYLVSREPMNGDQVTEFGTVFASSREGIGEIIFDFDIQMTLNEGDHITFGTYDRYNLIRGVENMTFTLNKIKDDTIDFQSQLKDISLTSFAKEILNRFGLTAFTSENSDIVKYKTINERLNSSNIIDWTNKFVSRTGEKYVYDDYARQNWFRYKYNDQDDSYYDGFFNVNNVNLQESRTVITSMTYAPELGSTKFDIINGGDSYQYAVSTFKMWERELDNNNELKYKPLDKRFYFLRGTKYNGYMRFTSRYEQSALVTTDFYAGSFEGMGMTDVIQRAYEPMRQLIQDSRIHAIELDIDAIDVINVDFDALYYFSQEQQYYILNKLNVSAKSASGEFVRVKKTIIDGSENPYIVIASWKDNLINTVSNRTSYEAKGYLQGSFVYAKWQVRHADGNWTTLGDVVNAQNYTINFLDGVNTVRIMYDTGLGTRYSNEISYQKGVISTKCYKFGLQAGGEPGTYCYRYYDKAGVAQQNCDLFVTKVKYVEGKEMIDLGGLVLVSQEEIPCA